MHFFFFFGGLRWGVLCPAADVRIAVKNKKQKKRNSLEAIKTDFSQFCSVPVPDIPSGGIYFAPNCFGLRHPAQTQIMHVCFFVFFFAVVLAGGAVQ